MLDLSWSHILIVLIVALVVVGPKDLPRLMRMAGRWVAKARAMADQFRKSFDEMARQSELDELRAELESLRSERPLADLDRTLRAPVLPPPKRPATGGAADALPPKEQLEPAIDAATPGPPE
ncbi:MAG: Sec-independent protein translocase protein TatB [Rhizomicrobium sp.]